MKGAVRVKSLCPNQQVFTKPIEHPDFKGHWLVIDPFFREEDGEHYFNVYQDGDDWVVEGQFYAYASEPPARDHARETCEHVKNVQYVMRGNLADFDVTVY